ncbi:alginate lyase family protein [Halomonas sp. M20]|uniref:alginate lyase family protein n=1 Tax=Halomonas sp. M20 TaxID=2763264 RepID=UPI001D09A41A|nr:alginate lyase family protein [Halomonas sp. M20]
MYSALTSLRQASLPWLCGALLGAVSLYVSTPAQALTYKERQKLDLSSYTVTDTDASYFDVNRRRALLKTTDNPILINQMDQLRNGESCRQLLAIPTLDEEIRLPGFYPSPDAWRLASEPMFQFEGMVSDLAGSYMATGDDYYSNCLVKVLDRWAKSDALFDFHYSSDDRQAWYATESMLFAAAMAYSIVRPEVDGMEKEKSRINAWLNRLAHNHSSIPGGLDGSCCNNHFYRRAVYASMIGVLTEDDELFRFGVSALYSALHDLTPEGGLPLELERGRRATHYQNYALLYLITNMQIIFRQGYDTFSLEVNGNDIHPAVDYAMAIIEDPTKLGDYAPHEQYRGFMEDGQYFSWADIYLSHHDDAALEKFIRPYRPLENRSAGGYITLYFLDPEAQRLEIADDTVEEKAEVILPDAD